MRGYGVPSNTQQAFPSRRGQTVIIPAPLTSEFANNSWYGEFLLSSKKFQLLQVEDKVDSEDKQGSWNIVISANIADATFPGGPVVISSPLVAVIEFGSGGAKHKTIVDAIGQVIAIPAEIVNVSVCWQQLSTVSAGVTGYPITLPVSATAYKAPANGGMSPPVKSYVINNDLSTTIVPVPPLAYAWTFVSHNPVGAGDLPLTSAQIRNIGPNGLYESVEPEVLASMARMHQFRQLPTNASYIEINLTSSAWRGTIEFLLAF
jgi:hypothetical protein